MLQVPNIVKKPVIWLPAIISSAILGPVGTLVLPYDEQCDRFRYGDSRSGGTDHDVADDDPDRVCTDGSDQNITDPDCTSAVVTLGISEFMRKKDWIKTGDMKVEFLEKLPVKFIIFRCKRL